MSRLCTPRAMRFSTIFSFHPKRSFSSLPLSIKPSAVELSTSRLSWKNLQIATRALHRDGLLVVEDILEHEDLNRLNDKMLEDASYLRSLGSDSPFNYNKSNLQQDPPLTTPYFSPSIYLNPLVHQIVHSVLGPRSRLSFISGNSAMSPTADTPPQSQPVHSDADFAHPSCPFALVVNVPLVDMTPENGSTEVWLGTQNLSSLKAQEGMHGERASGRIKEELLEERRLVRPPSQPLVRKGSVVLRDLRLWHCGKPNFTEETRVMLAMIHFAGWFENRMEVEFDEGLRPVVESNCGDVQVQASFIPRAELEQKYLHRGYGNSYDFNQRERLEGVF